MAAATRNSAPAPLPSSADPKVGAASQPNQASSGTRPLRQSRVDVGARVPPPPPPPPAAGIKKAATTESQPATELAAGTLIAGKYRLTHPIGEGGMGSVWAAVHIELGSEVAVKLLRVRAEVDERASERFVAEARMAAAIKHRFVVDIFDFGTTERGTPYMVLELLDGQELGQRIQHGPPLALKDAVRFIAQCLSGLEAVHRAGIVHRDLKPENIFLIDDPDGIFPKLLDFGIAKAVSDSDEDREDSSGVRKRRLTQSGVAVGTPSYMSPEQLRAQRDLDGRADIYSMGVILFELLAGRVPFPDDNVAELLVHIMTRESPRLRDLRPELGTGLSDVLERAMAKDREQRFATAGEMRDALQRLLPELPDEWTKVQDGSQSSAIGQYTDLLLRAAKDPFAAEQPRRASRLRRYSLLGGLAIALAGGGLWAAFGSKSPPRTAPEAIAPMKPRADLHPAVAAPSVQPPTSTAALAGSAASATPALGAADPAERRTDSAKPARAGEHAVSSHGTAQSRHHHAKEPKKLFRNLDF